MGYKTAANERSRRITLVRRIREALASAQALKITTVDQGIEIPELDRMIERLEREDLSARIDPID